MRNSAMKASATAAAASAALLLSACGGGDSAADDKYGLQEPGTITAAVSTDQPPFASATKSGRPVGFIVDVTDEVAKRLDLKVTYKASSVPGALQGLTSGQYDLAASGLGVTAERQKAVGFTKGLYWSTTDVLTRTNSKASALTAFKGKEVGAVTGTVQQDFVKSKMPEARLSSFQTQPSAVSKLLSGGLDAFVVGGPDSDAYRKQYKNLRVAVSAPVDHATAMAVGKSNSKLQKAIDTQVSKMVSDGTFLKIYDKWFTEAPAPELLKIWPALAKQVNK
ncbi:transporter substrate-binding domain-containing protein [Streptomyces sp. NPDC049954]|uniref:substrate-binding periplasmic protein n=1 Tax=Streptomyces sp. NPDC049954 TaxID=3155779 RepID=UPI00341D5905